MASHILITPNIFKYGDVVITVPIMFYAIDSAGSPCLWKMTHFKAQLSPVLLYM